MGQRPHACIKLFNCRVRTDQALKGFTLGLCLHLEAKTAYLAHALKCAGANVVACASNPLSTQDDVVAAMVKAGITVFAVHGSSPQDYERYLSLVLDWEPQIIIDDGGDLVSIAHATRPELVKKIIGGCEETTTGVTRLRSMAKEGALSFHDICKRCQLQVLV